MPASSRLSRRALLAAAGSLGAATTLGLRLPSALAAAPAAKLTMKDWEDIARIEKYLNGIKSMAARFQQWSPNGGVTRGHIYMRRPGKMRIEYDPPNPVLLVADGTLMSYYDSELDQLNQMPLTSTPAWFLLREKLSLTKDVTVTEVQRAPGAIKLSMYQTAEPDAGSVTLILRDDPLELQQWTIVDAQNNPIRIGLFDATFDVALQNSLFATPQAVRRGNRQD